MMYVKLHTGDHMMYVVVLGLKNERKNARYKGMFSLTWKWRWKNEQNEIQGSMNAIQ